MIMHLPVFFASSPLELFSTVEPFDLCILEFIKFGNDLLKLNLDKIYDNKFNNLLMKLTPKSSHVDLNCNCWVVNILSKCLSESESALLNKGLNFSLGSA